MIKKIKNFIKSHYWITFTILLTLLTIVCFINLGTYAVDSWDEARHGVNAYEMIMQNNYIANYYGGKLDYWNLKPPISYYVIMLGYKIFGYNAFGMRFFSVIAFIILVASIALFLKKKVGEKTSLLSIVFFLGTFWFFKKHFVKTGDADSLFLLFIGIGLISIGLSSDNPNWLNLTGFVFSLAFLTKSWHAVLIVIYLFFYWIFTKEYKIIKWWQYITVILCAVIPISIWAIFRYKFDGYTFFKEMIEYDLLKRTSDSLEGQTGYPFFYTVRLFRDLTVLLSIVIFAWSLIIKKKRKEKLSNLDKLYLISAISTYTVFAIANTKITWYIYPAYIPLIMAGATYLGENKIITLSNTKLKSILSFISSFILFPCVCASFVIVTFIQKPNELQQFISTLNIKDTIIYYEVNNQTSPEQNILLCTEWSTNTIITNGGYESFLNTNNSYIIISKKDYESKEKTNDIKIISSSNNYILCYNAK